MFYSHLKSCVLTLLIFINFSNLSAQEKGEKQKLSYVIFSAGCGLGSGYSIDESVYGIGLNIGIGLLNKNNLFCFGYRRVEEIVLFDNYNVHESVNSFDVTYGRIIGKNSLKLNVNAGIGLINMIGRGALISREGGWFFASYNNEKISVQKIGIPISLKCYHLLGRSYGIGLEAYANFNALNNFYGLNLTHQIGRMKSKQQ